MAAPDLQSLDAEFEAGLGQTPRPRPSSPPPDLDAAFEAGLQQAAPVRKAAPVSAPPPRLPFVTQAPGQPGTVPEPAPIPKPTPKPKPVKPVKIPSVRAVEFHQSPEESGYAFSQKQYNGLPDFAKNPKYVPAEGGKVAQILQGRAATLQNLERNKSKILGQLDQAAAQILKDHQAIVAAKNQLTQQGGSKQEWDQITAATRMLEQNRKRLSQRAQQIEGYWNEKPRVLARVQNLPPIPLHEGPYRPGEREARERRPVSRIVKAVRENPVYQFFDPFQQRREKMENVVPRLRAEAQMRGEYPGLPHNPGRTPQQRSDYNRQLDAVRRYFFVDMPGEGFATSGAVGTAQWKQSLQQAQKNWTPYQKSLVPIFAKQALAEREVFRKAGIERATVTDIGVAALSELIGGKTGHAVIKATTRFTDPAIAALQRAGVRKWGAEAVVKGSVAAGSGATAGAAAGAAGAGTAVYVETRDPKQALKAAKQAAGPGALIGGVFGAAGAGAETGLEHAAGAAKKRGERQAVRQAARQMAAASPGPKAKTPSGVEVRLRHTDPHALERINAEFEAHQQAGTLTPEAAQQHAQIQRWRQTQARREAQLHTELPPEELGTYHKEWTNPKNPAKAQRDQMLAQAEHLAETNPRLSQLLAREADEIQGEFIHDYLKKSNRVDVETPNPEVPTTVSAWRQLSPEEQAQLPGQLRQTLLMRDIQNSGHVLDPAADSVYLPKDIGVKSLADLEYKADQLYAEAQAHLDELFQPSVVEAPAPVSQQIAPKRKRAVAPKPGPVAEMPTEAPLAPVQATEPKVDVTAPIERAPVPEGPGEVLPPRADVKEGQFQGEIAGGAQGAAMRAEEAEKPKAAAESPAPAPKAKAERNPPIPGKKPTPGQVKPGRQFRDPKTNAVWEITGEVRVGAGGYKRVDARLVSKPDKLTGEFSKAQIYSPVYYDVGEARELLLREVTGMEFKADAPKATEVSSSPATPREITTEFKATHVNEAGKQVEFIRDDGKQVRVRDSGEYGQQFNMPKAFFEKTYKAIDEAPAPKPEAPKKAVPTEPKPVETQAKPKEKFKSLTGGVDIFDVKVGSRLRLPQTGTALEVLEKNGMRIKYKVLDTGGAHATAKVGDVREIELTHKMLTQLDLVPEGEAPTPKDVTLNTGRADLSANPKSGEFKTVQRKAADGTVITHTEGMAKGLENHPRAGELHSWVEGNAAKLAGVIERVVRKVLPEAEAARVRHAGVGLLEWGGEPAWGANLHNAGEPGGPTEILVGPFRTEEPVTSRTWYNQPSGGDNPRKLAREVVYTSLHEAAHNLVREEGQSLWKVMDQLYSKAGDDFFDQAIQEVTDALTGGKGDELSPEYLAARQVYLEVARGAGSSRRADGAGAAVGERSAAGASLSRGVPGGQRPVRPARGRNLGVDAESLIQDPVLHERYQANRVPAPESFKEKHLPNFERFWHGLTRTIPELPNKPEFAPLRALFREFRSLDDIASAKRTFVIQKELSGLSKPEYERLGEAVFLRNMAANVKRQKAAFMEQHGSLNGFEARLPREWTESALDQAMKRADDLFQNNPKIKSAYEGLDAARAEITKELKSLYKAVTGRELKLDLEDYHHQAIIAYAQGKAEGGSKTGGKPGFMKHRLTEGHDLEYYTDFIEHESRWLESAVRKTQTLKLWKTLLDDYDISKEVKARAAQLNDKAFLPSLQKLVGGTVEPSTLQKLAKLAAEDGLPDHVDHRFSDLLDGLEDLEKNGTPLSPEMEALLPDYGKFLTSRPKGQGLGWRPGQIVPEGYVVRSVDEISNIFATNAVSQKIAQEAQLLAGSVVGISADDLKKVMALGRRKEIIIPKEVGEALDRWQARPADEWEQGVNRYLRKGQGVWKAEKLINPLRGASYWIGNAVSDFDALFQGNPRALKRIPVAAKEVAGFLAGKRPSKNLSVWIEKGGLSGLLTSQEGIGKGVFGADPLGKFSPRKAGGLGKAWNTTLAVARLPHDWREATGRFAAFEEFLHQIERDIKSGGAGVPENWGASNPAEVMALKDKHDRAYKLANDLVGNYDELTAAGRYVRDHVVPFYSWWEVNTRRQLRLYKNAWDSPKIAAAYGKKVAGGPIPLTQAIALGRFAMKAATLSLIIDAANETFFPEERRELGDKKRGRPVLIVGRDEKGNVLTYDRLGNLPELMSWFGLDNHGFSPMAAVKGGSLKAGAVGGYAEAWLNGRMTIGEIGQDMGRQFVVKAGGGIGPIKVAAEVATGQNLMDVTDPSPNINRWDPLFNTIGFGLPALQRNLEGRPLRPGQGKVLDKPFWGYKTVDLSEEAYNEMRGYAHEWLAKKGKARTMAVPTSEKGIALYWHKKALKYGDTATAAVKLREYAQGATEDDYVTSLKKLSPLSAMSDAEKKEFVNSLAPDDLARLRRAYLHYQDLVAPEITERAARLERIIDKERPAESSLTPLEWQRKRTYLWIQRLAEGRSKQVKGMIERYLERHNPLKEMAKDDRELKRQLRKNERVKRMQRRGR